MSLQNLFNPKSIAVIGASSDKNKVGYALVANLIGGGNSGCLSSGNSGVSGRETSGVAVFPVSLDEAEIQGLKTYKSIGEIPTDIDLVLIAVRADIVPTIMEECGEKKVKTVIIIAAGFKEIGQAGAELEKQVAEIAKKYDITLLGPNCLGTIDTHSGLNASFANGAPKKGHTAFISQSGALGTAILDKALDESVGFSKFVSLGNEASLSEIEFMEYLKDDNDTKAILMYVEQLKDGQKFMRLASEITKSKPIVLIKAGRGKRGQQAVMSHTGSLAPEDDVFRAACKQSGIIVVDSIREFFNMAKLFELGIYTPLQRLIILTNAGGPAVVTSDLIDLSHSLSLVDLNDSTKDELRKVLPSMAAVNNPVDIIGDALSNRYESALKILTEVKEADAIVTLLSPQMMTEDKATAELLVKYNKVKPIIPVFIGGPSIQKGLAVLKENNLVNFSFPKDAIESLDNLARSAKRDVSSGDSRVSGRETSGIASGVMMSYLEMNRLFHSNGLNISGVLIKEKDGLRDGISGLGSDSFIMKVISPDVVHKTDVGAVKLDIRSLAEAEEAWDEMISSVQSKIPDAHIEGVLVQSMVSGKEVIVGMKRDPIFGPTVLFGLGGIFTEALKDTSMRIAPVTKEMAMEMIHDIRGIKILNGLRGEKPIDFDKLADVIVKISQLSMENSNIKEIDLNPVMVRSDSAEIVDARVMV